MLASPVCSALGFFFLSVFQKALVLSISRLVPGSPWLLEESCSDVGLCIVAWWGGGLSFTVYR